MADKRVGARIERWGRKALWMSLAALFLAIGLQKLTPYEAAVIRPFAARSPFLAWAYDIAGVRGASLLFAAIEIPTGLGLAWGAARPGAPIARFGAAMATATAFVTTSFLFTTPGAVVMRGGLPLLSLEVGHFFAKDVVLLAGALMVLGESLKARR